MEQLNTMLGRLLLALYAGVLCGCGYASSPGMVVETKEFPLGDKATLTVTRHLDDWRTGSLFGFEWYVVKCRNGDKPETLLMRDGVSRGLFSNEIPESRIRFTNDGIGYAYFSELVVFDRQCGQISYFIPGATSMGELEDYEPVSIDSVSFDSSGHGNTNISWTLRSGGGGVTTLTTDDLGAHWLFQTPDDGVRVALPSSASYRLYKETIVQLDNSEYVVTGGSLTKRPYGVVSPSTSLGRANEYRLLKHAVEIAKTKIELENWVGILLTESKDDYEVTIGYSALNKYHHYPYSTQVLINKKSKALANWLTS